ncbi:uncharacterized protein LOC131429863 [Malaya genurostris]|uniref:uncharacterized protein LOC131429863 n=1 Tax=Malaya genurostris TaxID=325434 RepID=UPI0026F4051F|nr:uncharacterized protein LOC131429863 [Malaya genurostris]
MLSSLVRRPLANLAVRNAAFLSRAYHKPKNPNFRQMTMNDNPIPEGDFFEEHARKNRIYNTWLVIGIITFGATVYVAKETGLFYLNYQPPKSID